MREIRKLCHQGQKSLWLPNSFPNIWVHITFLNSATRSHKLFHCSVFFKDSVAFLMIFKGFEVKRAKSTKEIFLGGYDKHARDPCS